MSTAERRLTPAQLEKRRAILRGAIKAFAERGYHGCKVADVAREAGVAYGLVYHYFSSKEELLERIFRGTWKRMLDSISEIEESGAPAGEQIKQVCGVVLRAWTADPDLVRVLVREVARSPHIQQEVDEIQHAFQALERIIGNGQQRGELRADLDPKLAAWMLYGSLEEILTGWVFERLEAGEADVERAEATVAEVLMRGLSAD